MISPVLPRELFDEIINQLTDELTDETSTLKSCSLVCRSFRRSAQKMLFDSIFIMLVTYTDDDQGPREPINLVLIVEQAPHLIEYIQELRISGNTYPIFRSLDVDGDIRVTGLPNALGIFSCKGKSFPINLRSLWLEDLPWHNIPSRLQGALVLLMTVHSLRDITLDHLMDCPADLVRNLPRLKSLSLTATTFPTNDPKRASKWQI